jgi:hypothetical protein
MIEPKERYRRFTVRLKTIFSKKCGMSKIPNFWYTPFEVYLLAHIQRAMFILTYNEYAYVDAAVKTVNTYAVFKYESPFSDLGNLVGDINYYVKDGKTYYTTRNGDVVEIPKDN